MYACIYIYIYIYVYIIIYNYDYIYEYIYIYIYIYMYKNGHQLVFGRSWGYRTEETNSSDIMYSIISFRKPNPPENRQLIVYCY